MNKNKPLKVIVDTTYLLPVFGISVEGLSDDDLLRLRELAIEGKVRLFCVSVVWAELLGKVYREAAKHEVDKEIIRLAIKSLFNPRFYKWIKPGPKSILLAYRIRSLGHRDNIDNILYATAYTKNMILLSMDISFREFLKEKGYNIECIKSHNELFTLVS